MTPCNFVDTYQHGETYILLFSEKKRFCAIRNCVAADCSVRLVSIYQTTRPHIPVDRNLDTNCHEGSKLSALLNWRSIVPLCWQAWIWSRLQPYSLELLTSEQYRIRFHENAVKLYLYSYFKNEHRQNFWTSAAHPIYSYLILPVSAFRRYFSKITAIRK